MRLTVSTLVLLRGLVLPPDAHAQKPLTGAWEDRPLASGVTALFNFTHELATGMGQQLLSSTHVHVQYDQLLAMWLKSHVNESA